MYMKRFEGKTALVTGSAKGIGRAIAIRLAQEGASVVVNSRHNDENVAETMRLVQAEGAQAFFVEADIAAVDAVKGLIFQAIQTAGTLDILVNNAGIEIHAPYLEVTEEQYDQ